MFRLRNRFNLSLISSRVQAGVFEQEQWRGNVKVTGLGNAGTQIRPTDVRAYDRFERRSDFCRRKKIQSYSIR